MRVVRTQAYQGHAVPEVAMAPRGPFPAEIMVQSQIVFDENDPDLIYPPGATAQNNYAPPKMYRCSNCDGLVSEFHLDFHVCDLDDEEDDEDGE